MSNQKLIDEVRETIQNSRANDFNPDLLSPDDLAMDIFEKTTLEHAPYDGPEGYSLAVQEVAEIITEMRRHDDLQARRALRKKPGRKRG